MIVRLFAFIFLLAQSFAVFSQTYSKTPLVTNLAWGIAFDIAPDGRIFTTQKGNCLPGADAQINVYNANGSFLSEFYDLSDSVDCSVERGLLGITVDPNFSSNHFIYVFYTYNSDLINGGDARIRIERFTDASNIGTQPTIICDIDIADTLSGGHQGGNIHFRPSDSTHIYVTIGDMHTDSLGWAAQVDNPYGKILRISKYPGDPPPSDNPFYDDGNPYTGNCDWIWAYGLRNSFDFCFGPNDSLYATENGTTYYDEVNLITRGGFYGWPYCEGDYDADTISLPCHAANSIAPLTVFPFPVPALTGIIFYTDTVWSQQQNHLIVSDFNHADLTDLTLGNAPAYDQVTSNAFWIDESTFNGVTCIQQGPEGCIYVLEIGDSTYGGIFMICPDAAGIPENNSQNDAYVSGPNPFSQTTSVTFKLHQSSEVSISLYDELGRETIVISGEKKQAGIHVVEINSQYYNLSPGMYSCVIRSQESSVVLRLVLN